LLFTRLARIIIRKHRAVFIIWLVALALSVPAILQVQHVIAYSETSYNPASSESSRAQDIVAKEFSISEGNSGVIVISANDVRGADVREFTVRLNETLHKDRDLNTINNITSIYDIYYQLLIGYTGVVDLQLYQLKNTTSLATYLEYGVPSIYVNDWSTIVQSGPLTITGAQIAQYNAQAYNASVPAILAQTPPAYQANATAYVRSFYRSWNQTFRPTQTYDKFQLLVNGAPQQREQNVTKGYPGLTVQPSYYNVTLPFFASLPLPPQKLSVFLGAARFFNVYNYCSSTCPNNYWNDSNSIRAFTVSTFGQSLNAGPTQQTIIGEIYDLGPSVSLVTATIFAGQLLRTYNILTYPAQPSKAIYNQFVSASNNTMLVILDFKTSGLDPKGSVQQIRNDVAFANYVSGQTLSVYVTGAPAFNYDIEQQSIADVERIDPITIILIIIIIGLFFSSLVAPLIPVSAIGLSVGVAFGLVYIIGTFVTSIHFLVLTLLPVAMLGAGSDYCVFLVSRYAEERRMGRSKKDAVERAVTWAGESIATSGATVIIAFASLAIASFGMLRSIGIAVMLGISIALLVSLTLVPASLMMFGDRLFWPRGLNLWKKKANHPSYYARAAKFTAQHSKLILLLALVVTVPAISTILSSTTGHDFIGQVPNALESKAGYNVMSQGFGVGAITPTYTIVKTPVVLVADNWINVTALRSISYAENSTRQINGVSKVYGVTSPSGQPIPYFLFGQLNPAEQQQMIRSMKPFLGGTGKSAMVWAVLSNEPYSDPAIATLNRIRGNIVTVRSQDHLLGTSTMLVGGETASVADLAASAGGDYLNTTTIVLVGVFVILLVALGSIFTPLRLIFTILLSISWAMALVIFVFNNYLGSEIIWMLPIMLLVVMVGLGLDYDIFLVTRIREYVATGSKDEDAIESAVEHTGGIISATGLVTAGAFGTMMLSSIPMLQQFGLAISIVVLLDAMIIRIYLVPSIMMHMKRLNWWAPGRLRRVPVRPEEKLIPPIPFITKLIVAAETLAIIALGMILYLDYSSNVFLQMFVQGTIASVLAGINVWTGVILGIASFAATYVILQGKIGQMKPKQWLPKLARWLSGPLTPKSTAHIHSVESGPVSSVTPAVQAQPPLPPTVATPQFATDHVEAIKKDEATRESTAEPKSTP